MENNNKRIAKNTFLLYIRMLVMMIVSLYTSRIVLSTLGIEDFGLYSIIGGVIVLFSFLNNALSSATQRFLTFEIGRNNFLKLKQIFNASLTIHSLVAVIILVLSETIGLWFVNSVLNIPENRISAANWTYQFTIIAFIFSILRIPFNALIIAHERMDFFAYTSVIEVLLKLVTVFIIKDIGFDKLITYSILLSFVALILLFVFYYYTKSKFEYTKYELYYEKTFFKQLISFSGWSLLGGVANISKTQGINILFNIYFGVATNGALSIANQISGTLNNFVYNFQLAANPQIVKYYAAKQLNELIKLISYTSKFSFYLIFILSFPVLLNIDYILKIWLNYTPEYTAIFSSMMIIYLLIETISGPLWMIMQATGEIKKYQIYISSTILIILPISLLLLHFGFDSYTVLMVNILLSIIGLIVRIYFVNINIESFSIKLFLKDVLLPISKTSLMTFPLLLIENLKSNNFLDFSLITFSVVIYMFILMYIFAKKEERFHIKSWFLKLTKLVS